MTSQNAFIIVIIKNFMNLTVRMTSPYVAGGVNLAVNDNSCKRTHAASKEQTLRCLTSSSSSRLGCLKTRADLLGQELAS